jgi:hypothetical protein
MSKYDEIRCPHCLKYNELGELEKNSEYECWSGENTMASCLYCEEDFNVECEHAGFNPTPNFDADTWVRKNIKEKPEGVYSHEIRDVVKTLSYEKDPLKYYKPDNDYYTHQKLIVEFVTPIWNKFVAEKESK